MLTSLKNETACRERGMRTAYALRTYPFLKENVRFSKKTVEQKCQDGIFEIVLELIKRFERSGFKINAT